ncbi:MAG: response regulator [Candidatus Muiribacteriota bacterium]
MKKILVVDDEKSILLLLQNFLQGSNCDVGIASNGSDGMKMLKARHFDWVILDISMPDIDGIDVCKFIREELKSDINIIIITAMPQNPKLVELKKYNIKKVFIKPFSIEEMKFFIDNQED